MNAANPPRIESNSTPSVSSKAPSAASSTSPTALTNSLSRAKTASFQCSRHSKWYRAAGSLPLSLSSSPSLPLSRGLSQTNSFVSPKMSQERFAVKFFFESIG